MKKRKFADGGEFELSDEAKAAGLRIGRNENIRPEDREAAIKNSASIVDQYRDFDKNPEAESFPVDLGQRAAPRASAPRVSAPRAPSKPDVVSDQTSRNVPAPKLGNQNDYSMNEQNGSGGGAAARAPSRGDYSRNGPIGDLLERAKESKGKVTPRARMVPSDSTDGMTSRKPKPKIMSRADKAERDAMNASPFKKGGAVQASKRADGIAQRGKTKGRMC